MSYFTRVANLLRGPSLEREFNDEIRFHLEERLERNIARGMTHEAAEADARRRFGSIEHAKAGMRAARLARPSMAVLPLLAAATLAVASGTLYFGTHERIYDVTTDVTAPVPIVTPRVEYTSAAMHEKVQGTVRVQCIVRRDGACSDVTVIRSLDKTFGLDDQAVRTIREWRFRPGMHAGTPVATRVKVDLRFTLR
jgi:TonB family protein